MTVYVVLSDMVDVVISLLVDRDQSEVALTL